MCMRHGPGVCHVEEKINSVTAEFVESKFTILDGVEVGVNLALRTLCNMDKSQERDDIFSEIIDQLQTNYEKYKATEGGGMN